MVWRVVLIIALAALLSSQLPASATGTASADDQRTEVTVWRLDRVERADATSGDGWTVATTDTGFTRTFQGPPSATFTVTFAQAPKPIIRLGETHSFTVKVTGSITGDEDDHGGYTTDAILLVQGEWPLSKPAVGVHVGCGPDGCSPTTTATGTFSVSPTGLGDEFRFGLGALNCAGCRVDYVYKAEPVDTTEFQCMGKDATVFDIDGDGLFEGTSGADVIVGTARGDDIVGNGGNDLICARGGKDHVVVSAGSSRVNGGAGNKDKIEFSEAVTVRHFRAEGQAEMASGTTTYQGFEVVVGSCHNDIFVAPVTDTPVTFIGGAGTDKLDYSTTSRPVTSGRAGGLVMFRQQGRGAVGTRQIDTVVGSRGADTFGRSLLNTYGGPGKDVIVLRGLQRGFGGPNRDTIVLRSAGPDVDGGRGEDTLAFHVAGWADGARVHLAKGWYSSIKGELTGRVRKIERVEGTPSYDRLIGSRRDEHLDGRGGSDIIEAKGGNDTVRGGDGDDYLAGGTGQNDVDGGRGFDFIDYQKYPLGVVADLSELETRTNDARREIIDYFESIEGVEGSKFADRITGDEFNNVLGGNDGKDRLWGGPGNDEIEGDQGDDWADGGPDIDYCDVETP